jgi:hypothetical protein
VKNHAMPSLLRILLHILLNIPDDEADWDEEPHHALKHVLDHARGRNNNEEEGDVRPSKLRVFIFLAYLFFLSCTRLRDNSEEKGHVRPSKLCSLLLNNVFSI